MNKRQIVNYPPAASLPFRQMNWKRLRFNRRQRILWSKRKRAKEEEEKRNGQIRKE